MYSGSLCDAYETIYEAIRNYRDYCANERKETIKTMTHLNTMIYRCMVPYELQIPLDDSSGEPKTLQPSIITKRFTTSPTCTNRTYIFDFIFI